MAILVNDMGICMGASALGCSSCGILFGFSSPEFHMKHDLVFETVLLVAVNK